MPQGLIFHTHTRGASRAKHPKPALYLEVDNWDDFGNKVQFHLSYVDPKGKEEHIGAVKILQNTAPPGKARIIADRTRLPANFVELDDDFISLGQSEEYYVRLREIFESGAERLLARLKDIAFQPALAADFEPTSAFRNAMMRENGAHRSRRFGRTLALGEQIREKLSFLYSGQIEGASERTDAKFLFQGTDVVPGRIVGIIGRNAVGKTRFLASLGADLAQISRASAETIADREGRFPNGRPLFTRVIAISYSAFDQFKRPRADASSSYVYCGIRNERGALSRASLIEVYKSNQERIRSLGLQSQWTRYMRKILGDLSENLASNLRSEIEDTTTADSSLSLLSSGQSILAHFVTALMAWIQPNSLVLFDEPETHLHPNAVSSLFLVLSDILESFDSYAVVATHSPLVIQEIPAKRVIMFQREQDVTTAEPLMMESFGESITELTRHVFETIEVDSVYRRTLKELANDLPLEDALSIFTKGLSLSAKAYLLAQYGKAKETKQ